MSVAHTRNCQQFTACETGMHTVAEEVEKEKNTCVPNDNEDILSHWLTPSDRMELESLLKTHTTHQKALWKHKNIIVTPPTSHDVLQFSKDDIAVLKGTIIVLEGGIGQGKTALARAMDTIIHEECNMPCFFKPEPIDEDALAKFIKFQHIPENAHGEVREMFHKAKQSASIGMQYSVMRNRAAVATEGARVAKMGGVAILDRGWFGDMSFMATTFDQAGVGLSVSMEYFIEAMRRYIDTGLMSDGRAIVVVRLNAPVELCHKRWLDRESAKGGSKYTVDYMNSIELAHDACARVWGPHVQYDNSTVNPPENCNGDHKNAVRAVLKSVIEMKMTQ